MGHRAVDRPRALRWWSCVAGFATLLSEPVGAQPAPSAKFPSEPAPSASPAPPAASGATEAAPPPEGNASNTAAPPYSDPGTYLSARGPQVQSGSAPAASNSASAANAPVAATPLGPDEHPRPDVGWSLGAGIVFGEALGGLTSSAPLGVIGGSSATTPAYRLSLERRLGRNTWLALNGSLSYTHTDQPVTYTSTTTPHLRDTLELESAQEALLLGIRQVVARGIVDVSMYVAVGGAHSKTRGDMPVPGEYVGTIPGGRGNALLVAGGIAVERMLIDSLALRLSADVVGATFTKQSDVKVDPTTREQTTSERGTQAAGIGLRPGIQFQFYF